MQYLNNRQKETPMHLYIGVYKLDTTEGYVFYTELTGNQLFFTPDLAAIEYDKLAVLHYHELAILNYPDLLIDYRDVYLAA